MPSTPETESSSELFTNLEGIERGNALLAKLHDLLPDSSIPDEAWVYGEFGEVTNTEYLKDFTMDIAMAGGQAEDVHSQLHKLIVAEKKICRFPERLETPAAEEIDFIKDEFSKFSDEEISRVASLHNATEAGLDINRQIMNTALHYYAPQLETMLTTTKVFFDGEKTQFPEFWQVYNKAAIMRNAIGTLRSDGSVKRNPVA